MLHGNPNAFAVNPIDRANNQRKNPDWVTAQDNNPDAQVMIVHRGQILIERGEDRSKILWLTLAARDSLPVRSCETVLLGLLDDQPVFACDASAAEEPPFADLGGYAPLRSLAPFLTPEELGTAGQALWLLDWHRRHQFCAEHGGETVSAEGGYKRINLKTGTEHFPRTDPVAIVLPYREDSVCLGRGPQFPRGFVSAFAGYLEPGETVEMCGARELSEETGLQALSMEYVFSQPWPFPSSLMMGFLAEVASTTLSLDTDEIEEAHWFTRAELTKMLQGEGRFAVPPEFAIAHHLIRHWVER